MSLSEKTAPDSGRLDNEPDGMVAHIQVKQVEAPPNKGSKEYIAWKERHGAQAIHRCYLLISENKSGPSRRAHGDAMKEPRRIKLERAQDDLLAYTTIYFALHEDVLSVIAMAAAGPWWHWVEVNRSDVPHVGVYSKDAEADEVKVKERMKYEYRLHLKFKKRKIFYLGDAGSDKELTRLRNTALIPLLERHGMSDSDAPQTEDVTTVHGKGKGKGQDQGKGQDKGKGKENPGPSASGNAGPMGRGSDADEVPRGSRRRGKTSRAGRSEDAEVPHDEGDADEAPKASRRSRRGPKKPQGAGDGDDVALPEDQGGPSSRRKA